MKKFLFVFIYFGFFLKLATAQINAIFVNDNAVNEESSAKIFTLIEQYLGTLAYFNAVEEERSPDYSEMEPFNLVIWYCGTDEDNLYLWNGNYQDNPELIEYLENGGNLWLMGQGFLNARYIKPPRNFGDDTFNYSYLGVSKWISESYTSDNGVGAPELLREYNSVVNTLSLKEIEWENPPEPFVDGCELTEYCHKAYYFGPGGYALYGQPTAFYLSNSLNKNMTFTFDPYQMNSNGNMSTLLSDVLRFYEDVLSDVDELSELRNSLKVYPNPSNNNIKVHFETDLTTVVSLLTLTGNLIEEKIINPVNKSANAQFSVDDLTGGIYVLNISNKGGKVSRKVVVLN